jgi:type I restriction enzyme S subunit
MSGRNVDFVTTISGRCALSVNDANVPAPPGWAWIALREIACLESGHTPGRGHPEYWDGDIPWIGIKDARVHHARTIYDTIQHVTQLGLDNSAARLLPANTVCLSRTASIGYVVVMGRPMATSQDFVNWVCSPALEPAFLKWIFLAEGEDGLRRFGKGSTHTTIYFPEVSAFHACIAPLNEQRRLVSKLDAVFEQTRASKARLERLPSLLDKLKRSILAAALRGDLTRDWRAANPAAEPASVLLTRIHAERRRRWAHALRARGKDPSMAIYPEPTPPIVAGSAELPVGWCWASVDQLSELQLGQQRAPIHAAAEKTHPYVRAANIKWEGLDLSDVKRMGFPDPERYLLRHGDVLLSEASGSPSEVGKPAIWRDEIAGCCYQKTLLRVRPVSEGASSDWLYTAFLADALLGRFARMAPGVGILHLTAERMLSWPVPIAPLPEQRLIVDRTRAALLAVAKLAADVDKSFAKVEHLERALLSKAFRGELVAQDPSDEPAAVLVERVRAVLAAESERPRRSRRAAAITTQPNRRPTDDNSLKGVDADPVDLVVAAFQHGRRLTATDIGNATGLAAAVVKKELKTLVEGGLVQVEGRRQDASYVWTA